MFCSLSILVSLLLGACLLGKAVAYNSDDEVLNYKEILQDVNYTDVSYAQSPSGESVETLGFLFETMDASVRVSSPINEQSLWLENVVNYRNIPGVFPDGMDYFFDGLATLTKFEFKDGKFTMFTQNYHSRAFDDWEKCVFFGTGTGPTRPTDETSREVCFKNPLVMMLPINGKLWLTIDTRSWGLVDMNSLDTLNGNVAAPGMTLNAHPACDRLMDKCFVQYPCPTDKRHILNGEVCIGEVREEAKGDHYILHVDERSRQSLDRKKLVQHSHSPCVTPNYVVAKLDEFEAISPKNNKSGLLKFLHQGEVNEWMVMDRRDNSSRILQSTHSFVNNHFWNCYETADGINVQTVAVTSDYLDMFFKEKLVLNEVPDWKKGFMSTLECTVPFTGDEVTCSELTDAVFDYPTFNPYYKMNPSYQYFYAVGPRDVETSTFFDSLMKFNGKTGEIAAEWHRDNIFLTEANFIPRGDESGAEDDGVLFTIAYNSEENMSYAYLFDAATLDLVDSYCLETMVPFHAHGIICKEGTCFSNP